MSDALVGGNTFVFLELHASRRSAVDQSIAVRVYRQSGSVGSVGVREQQMAEDIEHGEFLYEHAYNAALSRGLVRQPPGALVLENQEIGTRIGRGSNGALLDPAVSSIVDTIFNEMYQHLNQRTSAEISSTGQVRFAHTGASPSLGDIQKAEVLLREMEQVVRSESTSKLSATEAQSACSKLSTEFYSLVPVLDDQRTALDSLAAIEEQRQTVQLLRDLINVGEGTRGANALSDTQRKYKALRCTIESVAPSSEEYEQVARLVLDQSATTDSPGSSEPSSAAAAADPIEIVNVFRVSRKIEEQFFRSKVGNERLLLHGSRPSNIAGILSRGLLMPRTVVRSGVSRTDEGWLGSGLYFTDAISAAMQYAPPGVQGTQYVLCCSVALGRSKDYTTKTTGLSRVPTGYDSTHGVKASKDHPSVFNDDEYVIYNPTQQRMRYLVQLRGGNAALKANAAAAAGAANMTSSTNVAVATAANAASSVRFAADAASSVSADAGIPRGMSSNAEGQVTEGSSAATPGTAAAADPCGLLTSDGQGVPLRSTHVRAKILDMVGEVVVLQAYRNESDEMIEAKYVFPLDEMGAVCGFEAFINGKHIIGVVKEKEQARREYRAAIEQGKGAYLLEEEKPDVFTVRVGNLPPRADVLIKITYVTELAVDGPFIVFRLAGAAVSAPRRNEALDLITQNVTDVVDIDSPSAVGGADEIGRAHV